MTREMRKWQAPADITRACHQNAIGGVNDSIERQRDRSDRMDAALTARFARLEQALTLPEAQRGAPGTAGLQGKDRSK